MLSTITSKFQTTIPKKIREGLNLSVKDLLEWKIYKKTVIITPASKTNFLNYKNYIKTGHGSISNDIETARNRRLEKYR